MFFWPDLRNIGVFILPPWWFVDDALERHRRNIDNFVGNFLDLYCSWCVTLWIIDSSLLVHWRFVDDFFLWTNFDVAAKMSMQTLTIINVFLTSFPEHWCFIAASSLIVDDSLEKHIWNLDKLQGKLWSLLIFCVNLWVTDASLQNHWRILDEASKKHWRYSEDFVANINDHKCFFKPNLRNTNVSLLLRRWSLMILWRDIFETLIISMATFLIFIVFVVLNSESLMFHCCFIDESWMILRRNIDVTAKISLQTLMIKNVFPDIMSETLIFHYRFLDDSLLMLWRDIVETLINS